jgi:hypothetical protein
MYCRKWKNEKKGGKEKRNISFFTTERGRTQERQGLPTNEVSLASKACIPTNPK